MTYAFVVQRCCKANCVCCIWSYLLITNLMTWLSHEYQWLALSGCCLRWISLMSDNNLEQIFTLLRSWLSYNWYQLEMKSLQILTLSVHRFHFAISNNLLVMMTVISYRLKSLRLGLNSEDQWSAYTSFSLLEQNQRMIGMTNLELDSGKYPYVLGEPHCHVLSSCTL